MKNFCVFILTTAGIGLYAQPPGPPQFPAGGRGGAAIPRGLPPTYPDLEYAPADPLGSNGHKLDLYIPADAKGPLPVVVWTAGSAWMADTGKNGGGLVAQQLNPAGYAVAGVSIRSSSQTKFPGQLHDIKAAIRWLQAKPRSTTSIKTTSRSWETAPGVGPRRWRR